MSPCFQESVNTKGSKRKRQRKENGLLLCKKKSHSAGQPLRKLNEKKVSVSLISEQQDIWG